MVSAEEAGHDSLLWGGLGLLLLPYALALGPGCSTYAKQQFYYHSDALQLASRRSWRKGSILLLAMLAPAAMMLASLRKGSGVSTSYFTEIAIYSLLPGVVAMLRPPEVAPLDIADVAIVILIWIPLEIHRHNVDFIDDVTVSIRDRWPEISLLNQQALNLILVIFLVLRPLKDVGLAGWWHIRDFLRLVVGSVFFLVVALPVCLGSHRVHLTPHPDSYPASVPDGIGHALLVYAVVALPIEVFFRGVLQNLLHSHFDVQADITKFTALEPATDPIAPFPSLHISIHDDQDDAAMSTSGVTTGTSTSAGYGTFSALERKTSDTTDGRVASEPQLHVAASVLQPIMSVPEEPDLEEAAELADASYSGSRRHSDASWPSRPHSARGYSDQAPASGSGSGSGGKHRPNKSGSKQTKSGLRKLSFGDDVIEEEDDILDASGGLVAERVAAEGTWRNANEKWLEESGWLGWVALPRATDWFSVLVAATLYTIAVTNFHEVSATGLALTWWLGVCSGWVWRHTSKVTVSAVLPATVTFVATSIFQVDFSF